MRGDALDHAVDAAASAMTATAPPASLRGAVRARIVATGAKRSAWRLWVPALAAAALVLVAVWLWSRRSELVPAPLRTVASSVSSAVPATAASDQPVAVAANEGRSAAAPRTVERPEAALPAGDAGRRGATARVDAAARAAAAESVPPLVVEQLNVVALQPTILALDAVPMPTPLAIDRMDIAPLTLR